MPGLTKHPPKATRVGSIRTVGGESISVDGLTLIQVQFEHNVYPFYAHIIENLAYDAILGADFLSYYQSVIDLETCVSRMPPPTDTPPPFPEPSFKSSVHAYMTCILPPFSESVIPAKLDKKPDLYLNYNLVGLVESNPMLADRYSLCGAAEIVQISENSSIPFRGINPTSQPITIYRRTNLGQLTV